MSQLHTVLRSANQGVTEILRHVAQLRVAFSASSALTNPLLFASASPAMMIAESVEFIQDSWRPAASKLANSVAAFTAARSTAAEFAGGTGACMHCTVLEFASEIISESTAEWLIAVVTRDSLKRAKGELQFEFLKALQTLDRESPACDPESAASAGAEIPSSEATIALASIYTNGLASDRLRKACLVLDEDILSVDQKLHEIDKLMSIPATASARDLADALSVSSTAIQKTTWWRQNRKGNRNQEIENSRKIHEERSERIPRDQC